MSPDLAETLAKTDTERSAEASALQRVIIPAYTLVQRELATLIESSIPTGRDLTPKELISLSRSAAVLSFLTRRITLLNGVADKAAFRALNRISPLLARNLRSEAGVLGISGLAPPDPRILESSLSAAVKRIHSWNRQIRPQVTSILARGLLKGETPRLMARRVSGLSTTGPINRARAHALQNVRYAVVHASNSARLSSYTQALESGIEIQKIWLASIETCCISCAKLHGQIVKLQSDFPWRRLDLKILPYRNQLPHPPLHPNCRCRIIPATPDVLKELNLERMRRESNDRVVEILRKVA